MHACIMDSLTEEGHTHAGPSIHKNMHHEIISCCFSQDRYLVCFLRSYVVCVNTRRLTQNVFVSREAAVARLRLLLLRGGWMSNKRATKEASAVSGCHSQSDSHLKSDSPTFQKWLFVSETSAGHGGVSRRPPPDKQSAAAAAGVRNDNDKKTKTALTLGTI